MASWRTHPEEGELIRYCDGELRARETERVARHLEACWDCRTRLDDVKQTIGEYVRYRRDVLELALPQPPQPWMNLHAEFARMPTRRIFPRRAVWLIVCAATAGTGVLLYRANEPRQSAAPAVVHSAPQHPVTAVPPVRPPAAAARKTAPGPEDELRVIAALDRIGAGLGDPIEVVRTRDRIVVTCMGLEDARMHEVRAALAAMPAVTVELSPKPAASPAGSPLEVVGAPHPTDNPQFVDELLKSSEAMMARAHALRGLAERFPANVEAPMSASARALLAGMRERHEAALSREVTNIARSLQPMPPAAGGPADADWQSHAMRLFSDAEQVDRLLGVVFAGSQAASPSDRSALAAALAKLEADVR
jgi:hypothetical protein